MVLFSGEIQGIELKYFFSKKIMVTIMMEVSFRCCGRGLFEKT